MGDRCTSQEPNQSAQSRRERKLAARVLCRLWLSVTVFCLSIPLWAQQSRVYRDGNSWVEEITGNAVLGARAACHHRPGFGAGAGQCAACHVRGSQALVRAHRRNWRGGSSSRCAFRWRRSGKAIPSKARSIARGLDRFGAEFIVQVPRDVGLVKVETRRARWRSARLRRTIVANDRCGFDQAGRPGRAGEDCQRRRQCRGRQAWAAICTLTSGACGCSRFQRWRPDASEPRWRARLHRLVARFDHSDWCGQHSGAEVHRRSARGQWRRQSVSGRCGWSGDRPKPQGGSVRLASASGPVRVTTGGGSVELYKLGRGAQVETGAGPISGRVPR